jgi:hypothetical protein
MTVAKLRALFNMRNRSLSGSMPAAASGVATFDTVKVTTFLGSPWK